MSNRIFREADTSPGREEADTPESSDSFTVPVLPTFSIPKQSEAYDLAARAVLVERDGFRPFDGNPLHSVEEEAKARAGIIVANAEAQAVSIAEESRREGHAQGLAEGRDAGREDFLKASSALLQGLELFNRLGDDIVRENEEHLAAVAVAAAERVIHREVRTDPAIVRDVVRAALRAAAELDDVTVALHADDLELVRAEAENLVAVFDHLRKISFIAEPGIERGGCVLHTPCGVVDGRIPMQFEAVVEALRSALSKTSDSD